MTQKEKLGKQIIKAYKTIGSQAGVARKFNISTDIVRRILMKNNVQIKNAKEYQLENNSYNVKVYDENFNFKNEFNSITEAAEWILKNHSLRTLTDTKRNITSSIREAMINSRQYAGFYWDSEKYKLDFDIAKNNTLSKFKIYKNNEYLCCCNDIESIRNILLKNKFNYNTTNKKEMRQIIFTMLDNDLEINGFRILPKYKNKEHNITIVSEEKMTLIQRLIICLSNFRDDQIGYIYKITNTINGKMYIGLTTQTPEERFAKHIEESRKESYSGYNSPLHIDFREYKVENFKLEAIEQCKVRELPFREIYWIKQYQSDNLDIGYNQTKGGEMPFKRRFNSEEIIQAYKTLGTIKKVSMELNVPEENVSYVLSKNGIRILQASEHAKEKSVKIKLYDLEDNYINTFNGLRDAGNWVLENYPDRTYTTSNHAIGVSIKNAIINNRSYAGFRWDSDNYTKINDKFTITKNTSMSKQIILMAENKKYKFNLIKDCAAFVIKKYNFDVKNSTMKSRISRHIKNNTIYLQDLYNIKSKK